MGRGIASLTALLKDARLRYFVRPMICNTIPQLWGRLDSTPSHCGVLDGYLMFVRVFIPLPSHVRRSDLLPPADVGYVIWDTVDSRKNPATSIEVKVR